MNENYKIVFKRLDYFLKMEKIPNILFHGEHEDSKNILIKDFVNKIYKEHNDIKSEQVLYTNCAQSKGIKFIRDEIKLFAKSQVNDIFKIIILYNADKLTVDAQSALRRCIELFSKTTRFFMVIENKNNLLKPILSRFCQIYVPELSNKVVLSDVDHTITKINNSRYLIVKKMLFSDVNCENIISTVNKLYFKGVSGGDIITVFKNKYDDEKYKNELIITYYKIKSVFLNEKMLILFLLYFIKIRSNYNLENILFM